MIKQTLTNTKSTVQFIGEISEKFEIKTGVRKAVALAIQPGTRQSNQGIGGKLRRIGDWKMMRLGRVKDDTDVTSLAFADDIALVTNTAQEASKQVEVL